MKNAIGSNLKCARQALGLSAAELAHKIGKSHTSIHNFEDGTSLPSLITTIKILTVMGMKFEKLIEGWEDIRVDGAKGET